MRQARGKKAQSGERVRAAKENVRIQKGKLDNMERGVRIKPEFKNKKIEVGRQEQVRLSVAKLNNAKTKAEKKAAKQELKNARWNLENRTYIDFGGTVDGKVAKAKPVPSFHHDKYAETSRAELMFHLEAKSKAGKILKEAGY